MKIEDFLNHIKSNKTKYGSYEIEGKYGSYSLRIVTLDKKDSNQGLFCNSSAYQSIYKKYGFDNSISGEIVEIIKGVGEIDSELRILDFNVLFSFNEITKFVKSLTNEEKNIMIKEWNKFRITKKFENCLLKTKSQEFKDIHPHISTIEIAKVLIFEICFNYYFDNEVKI